MRFILPNTLNSNCVFDLFSLSVQVWFALNSIFAYGSISLSALLKTGAGQLPDPQFTSMIFKTC